MSRAFHLLPLTALVAASMSACGGSDSNSSASASTSGVVTGSYFEHAKVCIDTNSNGKCDAGETSTYTDANGAYTLTGQGAITVEVGTDAFRNDPPRARTPPSHARWCSAHRPAPTAWSARSPPNWWR